MPVERMSNVENSSFDESKLGSLGAQAFAIMVEAEKAKANANPGSDNKQVEAEKSGSDQGNVFITSARGGTRQERLADDIDTSKTANDFIKKNNNADQMSIEAVRDAGAIEQNWAAISGGKKYITADDMRSYAENHPEINSGLREALMLWSDHGMAKQLDSAGENRALNKDDKLIGKNNLQAWISKEAPKNATQFANLLDKAAKDGLTADVDVSKIGSDVFDHPEKYTAQERAAVINDLSSARAAVESGVQSGLWNGKKDGEFMASKAHVSPDNKKLVAEIDGNIAKLSGADDLRKFLADGAKSRAQQILQDTPQMKANLEDYYDTKLLTGDGLDSLFTLKDEKGKSMDVPGAVAGFLTQADVFHSALGLEGQPDVRAMVHASDHGGQIDSYYRDNIVSAKDYQALLDKGADPDAAMAGFGVEVANFNKIVDPALVEDKRAELSTNFGKAVIDQQFKQVTGDDLQAIFGKEGGGFDEEKAKSIFTEIQKSNPELYRDQAGKDMTPDQIVSGVRNVFDEVRQGAKVADAMAKLKWIDKPSNQISSAYSAGTLHLVSGVMAGAVTIARGVKTDGKTPTPSEVAGIVAGAATTIGVLTEGGIKTYIDRQSGIQKQAISDTVERLNANLSDADKAKAKDTMFKTWQKDLKAQLNPSESAGKFVGGAANVVTGVFGIISGAEGLKNGNPVAGGINIGTGSLSTVAGLLSGGEAIASLFGASEVTIAALGAGAGALGFLGATAGVGVTIWSIIEDVKRDKAAYKFAGTVDAYLGHYGINGNGGQTVQVVDKGEPTHKPSEGRPAQSRV